MDKSKILKAITDEWQPTSIIAKKINLKHGAIIGDLYELLIDDKKVERMKINKITYWKRLKHEKI